MDVFIAKLNIEHYSKLLGTQLEDDNRAVIVELLSREQDILRKILKDRRATGVTR